MESTADLLIALAAPAKRKRPTLPSKSQANASSSKVSAPTKIHKPKEKTPINHYDIEFRDDSHRERYDNLFLRGVVPTRFCDEDVTRTLRIEDDVAWLFSNVGWGTFLTKKFSTYKRATLEFLSSLKANTYSGEGFEQGLITFRLFNEEYRWTLAKLNEVLGLRPGGPRHTPKEWGAGSLWYILTGAPPYESKGSKAAFLRHPAIRYVHRLLAGTVLGRSDGGNVRKDDLYFLHHMLHAQPIDTGAFLVKQMEHLAKRTDGGGAILQGAFVTPIALYLGHKERLLADDMIPGTDALDFAACVSMNWCLKCRGTIHWKNRDGEEKELPSSEEMSLRDTANWSFDRTEPRVEVPSLEEPAASSTSHLTMENSIAILQASISEIKTEQQQMKEQLASMLTILENIHTSLRQQGSSNPPEAPVLPPS